MLLSWKFLIIALFLIQLKACHWKIVGKNGMSLFGKVLTPIFSAKSKKYFWGEWGSWALTLRKFTMRRLQKWSIIAQVKLIFFAKDIGAHIDKVVNLVELIFGKLDKTKTITSVGLSSFHDEESDGIQFLINFLRLLVLFFVAFFYLWWKFNIINIIRTIS